MNNAVRSHVVQTEALLRCANMVVAGGRLAGDRENYDRTQQPSALVKGFS